ncbi:hypothetical protein [Longimicrobium sp.]|uniref:hypothetical protein n=1 Tax=Longimicrobium sp. TaxID=2029185 RepID=UPI002BBA7F25|nr:hypothetical protein [Longimicrobium sp.]HSU13610.1 hypothetical protein [Longimicrobium sp.]
MGGDFWAINQHDENTDGDPETWWRGKTIDEWKVVVLNGDWSPADQLVFAVHEAYHVEHPEVEPEGLRGVFQPRLSSSYRERTRRMHRTPLSSGG